MKPNPSENRACCGCDNPDRRKFLTKLSLLLGGSIGAIVTLPPLGYLLAPILKKRERDWRDVGAIDDFPEGVTRLVTFEDASPLPWSGASAKTSAWLRHAPGGELIAFSVNCTHLGCPVRWLEDSSLFMCPCHGGVYYEDGEVAAGPPPEPLPRYHARLRAGRVEVLTSPIPITTTTPQQPA